MKRKLLAVLLPALLAPGAALAACNVLGANIPFGPYDPLSVGDTTVSGTISVSCDETPPPTVTILVGPSAVSGSMTPRRMQQVAGSDTLAYNLFVDPQGTTIWGDGTGGTATVSERVFKSKPWTATIYGRMPGNQDVAVGPYADMIGITINF